MDGGLITAFSTTLGFPRGGSNVAAGEAGATLDQLATTAGESAARTSMLVARIDNDRCLPLLDKEAGVPRPTGSIFKLWVLGSLAEEIRAGRISPSAMVPFTNDEAVPGSALNSTAPGTQISIRDLANLMLGISDNTSTDLLLELVGRDRAEQTLRTFGNRNRELMTPFLKVNEQFHVFWSLSPSLATEYAAAGDEEQRAILTNSIEPLGPVTAFPQSNQVALYDSSWTASAYDVCQAYAGLRKFDNRSDEFKIIEESAGAEVALLSVRNRWDRVWQKGGSLANNDGNYVFTLSWMFESDAKGAFVVVIMASNRDGTPVDSSSLFSVAARAEQIVFNR
ncbi:MAG: serine hydrolase [Pseudomonadota bacterium]